MSLVIDCSVAVAWCIDDEASPETDALLERVRDEGGLVPGLWHLELGNVLLQAERRGRLSARDVAARPRAAADAPDRDEDQIDLHGLGAVLALRGGAAPRPTLTPAYTN